MKVFNLDPQFGYDQWTEGFVYNVLTKAEIDGCIATILDIQKKRIHLSVDCQPYMIYMNSLLPTRKDKNGMMCGGKIEYTLYEGDELDDDFPLKEIAAGTSNVAWVNDSKFFKSNYMEYLSSYENPKELGEILVNEELSLYVEPVNHHSFGLALDVQAFAPEEQFSIAHYFANGEYEEVLTTPEVDRYLKSIEQACTDRLIASCFDEDDFDPNYTHCLLLCCSSNNLCSLQRTIEEEHNLSRLYDKHKKGDATALSSIRCRLGDFLTETKPYVVGIN